MTANTNKYSLTHKRIGLVIQPYVASVLVEIIEKNSHISLANRVTVSDITYTYT